jgi:alpha-ketoglutarate-dependent 2,4-dichlorophenoxyacetate dioxygenase|tara:strand:+ start:323 stop:1243 length:921 start_codon:yes stop_codon:yes gene_type:complete
MIIIFVGIKIMRIEILNKKICFGGIVSNIDLTKDLDKNIIKKIDNELNNLCVLVFKNQKINDEQQLKFSKYFGEIEGAGKNTTIRKSNERRLSDSFGDVSNLDVNNKPFKKTDNKRYFALGNRLWHTDASFKKVPAKYSLLSGRKVAKVGGETQFSDMRSAYDKLLESKKKQIETMVCYHSLIYSRHRLGIDMHKMMSKEEIKNFEPVKQPLVRMNNLTKRKSIFLASHIGEIEGMEKPDTILFVNDLMEHCTKDMFLYTHQWDENDLVIWDNRQSMHRGLYYDDQNEIRDVRRTTISGSEMLIAQ